MKGMVDETHELIREIRSMARVDAPFYDIEAAKEKVREVLENDKPRQFSTLSSRCYPHPKSLVWYLYNEFHAGTERELESLSGSSNVPKRWAELQGATQSILLIWSQLPERHIREIAEACEVEPTTAGDAIRRYCWMFSVRKTHPPVTAGTDLQVSILESKENRVVKVHRPGVSFVYDEDEGHLVAVDANTEAPAMARDGSKRDSGGSESNHTGSDEKRESDEATPSEDDEKAPRLVPKEERERYEAKKNRMMSKWKATRDGGESDEDDRDTEEDVTVTPNKPEEPVNGGESTTNDEALMWEIAEWLREQSAETAMDFLIKFHEDF